MNGLLKIPMQFLILLVGVLVFSFYQFNRPPVFFNSYEVSQVKQSPYGAEYNRIEGEYNTVFEQKKAKAQKLINAINAGDDQAISSAKVDLNQSKAQTDTLRKQAVALIKKNNDKANADDTNYIFLSFVTQYLPKGLIGLLIAIIFLASMGSTASALNSLASTSVIDIYKRMINKEASDEEYVTASRLATVFWGLVCIGMALYASKIGNLLEAVNQLGSYIYGTMLGVFMVAFFLKKISGTAVFIAAIITEAIVCLCGYFDVVAYLWFNAIGCIGVVLIATILNAFIKPAASRYLR